MTECTAGSPGETGTSPGTPEGFEVLRRELAARERRADSTDLDFDILIVGSGYGGAIAAHEFAGCRAGTRRLSVCILERGSAYSPGSFPNSMSDLAGHVRLGLPGRQEPAGRREGLFDFRLGKDASTLVANGLGGGSLINAGVMLPPSADVLADDRAWPAAILSDSTRMTEWLERARRLMVPGGTAAVPAASESPAAATLRWLSEGERQGTCSLPPLSVAPAESSTIGGMPLHACIGCGDCFTGCNHGAKHSLDTSLLAAACRRDARIYTGATVLRLERRADAGWIAEAVHTDDKLRARQGAPLRISARRVILAAGTLGSTEILLRSQSPALRFSTTLGSRFSTNGDSIAVAWGLPNDGGPTANDAIPPTDRKVGPTISAMLDWRDADVDDERAGIVVQTLVIPAALRWLYGEVTATSAILQALFTPDSGTHSCSDRHDPIAVDEAAVSKSLAFAMMGDDGAAGQVVLRPHAAGDGAIEIRWPGLRTHTVFRRQVAALRQLARARGKGLSVLPNPAVAAWPEEVGGEGRGGPLTVHPLGGCPMADDAARGVVDHLGRVFDPSGLHGKSTHDGLVVLDGAIIPRALGINPALTIAALALRACEGLREAWGTSPPPTFCEHRVERPGVPAHGSHMAASPAAKRPTRAVLRERLSGPMDLRASNGTVSRYIMELTLCTEPFELAQMHGPQLGDERSLALGEGSMLRMFKPDEWDRIERPRSGSDIDRSGDDHEARLGKAALLTVPLRGTIEILGREDSTAMGRTLRAFWAYVWNRGIRDLGDQFAAWSSPGPPAARSSDRSIAEWSAALWRKAGMMLALSSRAGEVRTLRYRLARGEQPADPTAGVDPRGIEELESLPLDIIGFKRLTYARRANPWKQLSRLEIEPFPGTATGGRKSSRHAATLELDLRYLARQGHPLLRITDAQDQPTAIADLASLALYWARLLIGIHLWSFRAPDPPEPGTPDTSPRRLPGIPAPEIHRLEVDASADGQPVVARLTRYRRSDSPTPPVLLIHGYSTSGTTFAHPDVDPCLASWLWERGHDVWVADLRTSIALDTAMAPWRFEDVALVDLPEMLAYMRERMRAEKGAPGKIDVVAHCMGAAMLSMAVLREPPDAPYAADPDLDAPPCNPRLAAIRRELPNWLNKVVLTQVGPVVTFAPANVLRAYLMRWLRHYLPPGDYRFRIEGQPSALDALLDRLLATLPYPDAEHDLENPRCVTSRGRANFAATRHRMDALYGRDFSLSTMDARVLARIDDIFGPPNLETVAQTLHFARNRMITDRAGRGGYLDSNRIRRRWTFETLYLHSEENGLSDPATLALMEARFADEGVPLRTEWLTGVGHQDSLIGREAHRTFEAISGWLATTGNTLPAQPLAAGNGARQSSGATLPPISVRVPACGPFLSGGDRAYLRLGIEPALGMPILGWLVPVLRSGHSFQKERDPHLPVPLEPTGNGWYRVEAPGTAEAAHGWLLLTSHAHPDWVQRIFGDDAIEQGITLATLQARLQELLAGVPTASLALETAEPEVTRQLQAFLEHAEQALGDLLEKSPASVLEGAFVSNDILEPVSGRYPAQGADLPQPFGLAVASCQYPAGMLDSQLAQRAVERLADLIESGPRVGGLLLLGDQIYADATAGLFDPIRADERHSRPYRELLESDALRRVLRRVPVHAMLDDHEIQDDWEPTSPSGHSGEAGEAALASGTTAYRQVFGQPAVDAEHAVRDQRTASNALPPVRPRLWYASEVAGHPIFMLDTRTRRQHRDPSRIEHASILDPIGETEQVDALETWLLATRRHPGPRFVASPAMLLPRRLTVADSDLRSGSPASAIRSDAWDGYPGSLHRLLGFISHSRQLRLVFLSGDEHLSCVARITLATGRSGRTTVVHSVHSSALYAPWPFANSRAVDFAARETFSLRHFASPTLSSTLCHVRTRFAAFGAGFARLRFEPRTRGSSPDWRMRCEFFDCAVPERHEPAVVVPATLR